MNEAKQTLEVVLTRREREILLYVARGLSSKQIAEQLIISENTVANHRKNMLSKAGAKSSAELIFRLNGHFS